MTNNLVRFGVAMEASLIEELDRLCAARSCNRSELLRDLARAEVNRETIRDRVPAFAAVTLVYNHHVRELSERLTALQHDLGEQVRSAMHVHLDHEHCLETIVMRGRSDQLKDAATKMMATRGVLQDSVEYVAEGALGFGKSWRHKRPPEKAGTRAQHHEHDHEPGHEHDHGHDHAHDQPPQGRGKVARKPARAKASPRRGS